MRRIPSPLLEICLVVICWSGLAHAPLPTLAQNLEDARVAFRRGDYSKARSLALTAIEGRQADESWFRLAAEVALVRGEYAEAAAIAGQGIGVHRNSIHLRRLAATAELYCGNQNRAVEQLEEIGLLYELGKWRYRRDEDQTLLADYYLQRGRDAREVLTTFLRPLGNSSYPARMAIGNLALSKSDDALAAENFRAAAELQPDDPEPLYGLARAYESSDPEKANQYLAAALERNPNFVPALLRGAEGAIDGENYERADQLLEAVLAINPRQVPALALKAVIAHLHNDFSSEGDLRQRALSTWKSNPEFDHLVGKKLSQKYRFEEGARYQERALVYDPQYQPAKMQLALDRLRLGDTAGGWALADEVYQADPYQILAHNLVALRDRLAEYATLSHDDFVIRMAAREARLYGDQVLALLREAKSQVETKYDVQIKPPIFVEIYATQQDFAVRTFGMPGVRGYLGVCFGNVVTMNSPASQGNRASNWQAVLWHEFCHVITLQKTANKMPRWLSEGISVYEERQRNPAWGQSMTPRFRELALSDEVWPISRLSEAFLNPRSPEHLLFAYYESSLAVEFLLEKFGQKMLNRLLVELGLGVAASRALEQYAGPLEQLDREFIEFVRRRAKAFGNDEYFQKPAAESKTSVDALGRLAEEIPNNYFVQRELAQAYLREKQWEAALAISRKMLDVIPEQQGRETPYAIAAAACRGLGDTEAEMAALREWVRRDADAYDGALRWAELAIGCERWDEALEAARAALAVNPMLPAGHRFRAAAAEKLGLDEDLIEALEAEIELGPRDPADVHFRLAQACLRTGNIERAKREVLRALEFAPRYREAQHLLLQIVDNQHELSTGRKSP